MKKPQENLEKMAQSVWIQFQQNTALWQHIPALAENVQKLKDYLALISELSVNQANAEEIPGTTVNKLILREELCIKLISLSSSIYCIGLSLGQFDLCELVRVTLTDLRRFSETKFIAKAQIILDQALIYKQILEQQYDTPPAAVNQIKLAHNEFKETYAMVKALKAEYKTATSRLKSTCKQMREFLHNTLDKNMNLLIKTPFYLSYKNARRIYNYTAASNAIAGTIRNDSGNGIYGVKLTLQMGNEQREKVTTRRGTFFFKRLDPGLHTATLIVRKKGFISAEYIINLRVGYTNKVEITLEMDLTAETSGLHKITTLTKVK
jgi:hypothetical protein